MKSQDLLDIILTTVLLVIIIIIGLLLLFAFSGFSNLDLEYKKIFSGLTSAINKGQNYYGILPYDIQGYDIVINSNSLFVYNCEYQNYNNTPSLFYIYNSQSNYFERQIPMCYLVYGATLNYPISNLEIETTNDTNIYLIGNTAVTLTYCHWQIIGRGVFKNCTIQHEYYLTFYPANNTFGGSSASYINIPMSSNNGISLSDFFICPQSVGTPFMIYYTFSYDNNNYLVLNESELNEYCLVNAEIVIEAFKNDNSYNIKFLFLTIS